MTVAPDAGVGTSNSPQAAISKVILRFPVPTLSRAKVAPRERLGAIASAGA